MTLEAEPATQPPDGKGARTRQRLLEIAVRRFARDGFRRTSVSAVAREARLTPAAAYAYFPSKEAMFTAAVDADAGSLIEEASTAAARLGGDHRERRLALLASLFEALDDHPLARRVLSGEEPEVIGRLLQLPALVGLRERMAEELAADQVDGTVRVDVDPATMALGLETIVLSLLMGRLQAMDQADPAETELRGLATIEVLDAALRPPP